ncbi:sensor protein LytS [Duganella sp. Leaf126]|uniref:sensor histidine kinase n=1 Tax=Duganella sp. Leaf126 TaxID=1736266 RepID=UPI0006FFA0C6|nr:histidine kinase [Duganella sp. Leaf126]KQQ46418.1 sensor protein LytS [Duganella sp. Leaf126]
MTERRPLPARLHWYWIFQLAGWNFLPLLLEAMTPAKERTLATLAIAYWGVAAGLLISHWWRGFLKRRIQRRLRVSWKTVAIALPLLSAVHTAVQFSGYVVIQPFGMVHGAAWLPGALLFWWGVYLVWTTFYLLVAYLRRNARLEAEALQLQLSSREAELRALQAQVNPHFFFNSMNSVRALVYQDQDAAAQMIDQLASVMRYALQSGHHDTVPLAAEIEAVQAYLAIEKIRFEERLRIVIDIGPGMEAVRIPPMTLQTLVENAVKYGVETSATGSDICIHARRDGQLVRIEIANHGTIAPFSDSTRVGLTNTRQRLALTLGAGARLDLAQDGGWVRATMTVPEMT